MDTSTTADLLSYTASFFNVLLFLTGVPTCLSFLRQGGVGGKQPGPFVVGCACCAVWIKYGLLVGRGAIWKVNAAGLALNLAYTGCYAACAGVAARRRVLRAAVAAAAAMAGFLFYLSTLHEGGPEGQEKEKRLSGLAGAFMSICFAASSLDALRTVIREKSTQSLQKPFILMVFAVTTQWCLYGWLVSDGFVCYPNAIASAVSGAQLTLFCIYPGTPDGRRTNKTKHPEQEDEDEGLI